MSRPSWKTVLAAGPSEAARLTASRHARNESASPVQLVDLPTIDSETSGAYGAITVLTGKDTCPFDIKRILLDSRVLAKAKSAGAMPTGPCGS